MSRVPKKYANSNTLFAAYVRKCRAEQPDQRLGRAVAITSLIMAGTLVLSWTIAWAVASSAPLCGTPAASRVAVCADAHSPRHPSFFPWDN